MVSDQTLNNLAEISTKWPDFPELRTDSNLPNIGAGICRVRHESEAVPFARVKTSSGRWPLLVEIDGKFIGAYDPTGALAICQAEWLRKAETMNRTIRLEILMNVDNDAFGKLTAKAIMHDTLAEVRSKIGEGYVDAGIKDVNGNTVGSWRLTETP